MKPTGADMTAARCAVDDAMQEHRELMLEGKDPGLLVPDLVVRHVAVAIARARMQGRVEAELDAELGA